MDPAVASGRLWIAVATGGLWFAVDVPELLDNEAWRMWRLNKAINDRVQAYQVLLNYDANDARRKVIQIGDGLCGPGWPETLIIFPEVLWSFDPANIPAYRRKQDFSTPTAFFMTSNIDRLLQIRLIENGPLPLEWEYSTQVPFGPFFY
jgi:hypothetical protein